MNIALYNMEPQFKNHAIEQMRLYYTTHGHNVEDYIPIKIDLYDKICCSSIFTFTPKDHLIMDERWQCGGTGFDIYKRLPPEIEATKIHQNFGWTQRGCNNNCVFCVVPQKEGRAHPTGDIYDIWDGKEKNITLHDNNILQLPEHFELICKQIKKHKLRVDWNQGLDIRQINHDNAELLHSISHIQYHFAFDHMGLEKLVEDRVNILKQHGLNFNVFCVLIGCQDRKGKTAKQDIEEALYRLNILKALGQRAYVMRYRKVYDEQPASLITKDTEKLYIAVASWANSRAMFTSTDFIKEYLGKHDRGSKYKKYFDEIGL